MKSISEMSIKELAGLVCQSLRNEGISVTLTGGACVSIWSKGKYVSHDLDFIEEGPAPRRKVSNILGSLGFKPKGRHFVHPQSKFFVEFPTGPLMVGDALVKRVREQKTRAGRLRLLSPTDCVKDRLAAFFHWNDRQSLEQALLVAKVQRINMADIRRWSMSERNEERFQVFEQRLSASRRRRRGRAKTRQAASRKRKR